MLTKGAIGNLVNRYKAVLKKCNLINVFGSLAVASMLVMGATGVAEAAEHEIYVYKGTSTSEGPLSCWESGAVGGWFNEPAGATSVAVNFKNINGDLIVGGNFAKEADIQPNVTAISTNNTVKDVTLEGLVGGNGAVGDINTTYENLDFSKKHTSSTTIINGNFGKTVPDGDVPELLVISGDLLKHGYGGQTEVRGDGGWSSNIEKTSLTIEGGTYNAAIIGGSSVIEYYIASYKGMTANVGTATTTIKGGEFNHPIFAGGMTYGGSDDHITSQASTKFKDYTGVNSTVDTAILNISNVSGNLSINESIYAGGLQSDNQHNTNTVTNAVISINNATVSNIYGTNAALTQAPKQGETWGAWQYTPLLDKTVNTELTLTNTTATGEVFIPKGKVELRVENKGKVKIADFKPGADVPVTMSADGVTNDAFGGDAQKLVDESFDMVKEQKDGSLIAEAGAVVGEVTGKVVDGVVSNVVEKKNETVAAMSDLPTINHMLTRVEMNDLRKRMGDIRLLEGNTGVWARWDGGKLKGDSGLTNDFHKIQIGADTVTGIDNLRLGASFSYTNGDMDFAKASAESDTLSFAGYGVWTAENGIFADVIARLAVIDTEVQTNKVEGDLDNLAFSLSGEFGWRYDFCNQFFVEPQVELTYTYIDSDEFKSNGAKFEFDDSDSLIGRAGLAAGWKLPNDLGDLYARASVVQEFMGDGKLTASMGSVRRYTETDGDDTWFEYGVGTNVKVSKNAYVFADVERTEGAKIDEEWRGTVGFRFNF